MATIETRWTKLGLETLINKGVVNTLVGYSIGDNFHNYSILGTETVPQSLGGNHIELTNNVSCVEANGIEMYAVTPTPEEITNSRRRLKFNFVGLNCDNVFVKSGLNLRVNVNQLLNRLVINSTNYSFGMDGLGVNLWDYISINIEEYDPTTEYYRVVDEISNTKFMWSPLTSTDAKNYSKVSPTVMVNEGDKRHLNITESRFQAPFGFYFKTTNVNGVTVNATNGTFNILTGGWGYWVNNNQFLSITDLETSDLNLYTSIVPAFYIGNTIYKYTAAGTSYGTAAGLVGYLPYFLADDGTSAITGLYNQAYLAFKSLGTVSSTNPNVYEIVVNTKVTATDKRINGIDDIVGNYIQTIFSFDTSNTTDINNIVEILN